MRVVELDTGVSLPTTELGLAGELGDSLNSSLELVSDEQDLQKSPPNITQISLRSKHLELMTTKEYFFCSDSRNSS